MHILRRTWQSLISTSCAGSAFEPSDSIYAGDIDCDDDLDFFGTSYNFYKVIWFDNNVKDYGE